MKMLDASALIAILYGLDRPDLIDKLLKLGHALAVAGHAVGSEPRGRKTKRGSSAWCGRAGSASLQVARRRSCRR